MTACTLTIDNNGQSFDIPDGDIILDAALAQGIALPHQCRGASCGTCKARVLDGEVDHGWSLGFALSDEEKAQGFCLLCQARPISASLRLRTVNPLPGQSESRQPQEKQARVLALSAVSSRVRHLVLQVLDDTGIAYSPGCYAELQLPGVLPHRVYSFASPQGQDGLVDFYIALHPQGKASGHVHHLLKPGDQIGLRGPFGSCALPKGEGPVLCLAGGTGIAPVLAIVEDALAQGLTDPVHLLFAVREDGDVFALERLHRLRARFAGFRYDVLTDLPGRLATLPGLIPQALSVLHQDLSAHRLIVSGAPGFVEACLEAAQALDARPESISIDRFAPVAG